MLLLMLSIHVLLIISSLNLFTYVDCKRGNKKKVLIIGEIPDDDTSASSSSPQIPSAPSKDGSIFVPVAAYSVTHSRVSDSNHHRNKYHSYNQPVRRSRPVRKHYRIRPAASSPTRTTESAVYGYVQKPEIVEFRGQYFYGPNSLSAGSSPPSRHSSLSSSSPTYLTSASSSGWSPVTRYSPKREGLGPGGLLLATLPLILAPMLSYLFTPMVIPVTATIAAGKRKKRSHVNKISLNNLKYYQDEEFWKNKY